MFILAIQPWNVIILYTLTSNFPVINIIYGANREENCKDMAIKSWQKCQYCHFYVFVKTPTGFGLGVFMSRGVGGPCSSMSAVLNEWKEVWGTTSHLLVEYSLFDASQMSAYLYKLDSMLLKQFPLIQLNYFICSFRELSSYYDTVQNFSHTTYIFQYQLLSLPDRPFRASKTKRLLLSNLM